MLSCPIWGIRYTEDILTITVVTLDDFDNSKRRNVLRGLEGRLWSGVDHTGTEEGRILTASMQIVHGVRHVDSGCPLAKKLPRPRGC
jgi:hypothetical protein